MSPVAVSLIAFIAIIAGASFIHLIEIAVSGRKETRP